LTNKSSGETVRNKIWSYESPTPAFKDIKSYLSFYANDVPWECFVDEEKVSPQEGMCPDRKQMGRTDMPKATSMAVG
jgi:hypothetical protein